MARHSELTLLNVHRPYRFTYANAAARAAEAGAVAADVGCLALQADNNSLWMLTATTPTWVAVADAGGSVVDAAAVTYTPSVATDWDSDADPGDVDDALNQLAERIDDVEVAGPHAAVTLSVAADVILDLSTQEVGLNTQTANYLLAGPTTGAAAAPTFRAMVAADLVSHTHDAADLTYTPSVAADWDSDADPGDVDNALNQLAERVDDLEGASVARKGIIGFTIDGGGIEITDGYKGVVPVPAACTIKAVRMAADQSGSIVVDVWAEDYANYPPTDADTITAAAPPTITTATKSEDTTLTDWIVSLAEGDWLAFNVDSCTTITKVVIALFVEYT
jgi:hypothetical protein